MAQVFDLLPSTAIVDRKVTMKLYVSGYMSNFQGDPDNANHPRIDSDGRAFMTPMGFKRKTRDTAVWMGLPIHVARGGDLSAPVLERAAALGFDISEEGPKTATSAGEDEAPTEAPAKKGKADKTGAVKRRKGHALVPNAKDAIIRQMGEHYWDFCAWGGTLTTLNHGETGPIQVGFGVTVDPVEVMELTIGRVAVANAKEAEQKDRTLGTLTVCKYGLMAFEISISPKSAARTGLTWGHYETFLEIIRKMWDATKSTGRCKMVNERLVVFLHSSPLGDCQDARLTDAVQATWVNKAEGDIYPRSFKDYEITIDKSAIPSSVQMLNVPL
jgi:CRISPR-associated protein Csd2